MLSRNLERKMMPASPYLDMREMRIRPINLLQESFHHIFRIPTPLMTTLCEWGLHWSRNNYLLVLYKRFRLVTHIFYTHCGSNFKNAFLGLLSSLILGTRFKRYTQVQKLMDHDLQSKCFSWDYSLLLYSTVPE